MSLPADILATFDTLFAEAQAAGEPDPTAMALATADADGRPSVRMVLLKSRGPEGFVFYTHVAGRKGRELAANPRASLLFFWPRVRNAVQVRIEGDVARVADAEADAYFASRPRESQLGAWASDQSDTLPDRASFDARCAGAEARFAGAQVPRPAGWTGYRVIPDAVEFWYGAQFRLHERWLHERAAVGSWSKRMLYP
ncbi:pyridoxamine 5'-phosphate oxidase [Thermomonas brevis]